MGDIFVFEKLIGLISVLIGFLRFLDVFFLGIGVIGFILGDAFLIRRGSLR